jgi:hypothetical protein
MSENGEPRTSSADLAEIFKVIEDQQRRKDEEVRQKCCAIWLREGQLDNNLLHELASSRQAQSILSEHPLWILQSPRHDIDVAFDFLKRSRIDALRSYGEYHALLTQGIFSETKRLSIDLTESIFRFAFAASALVQAYRRFESAGPYWAPQLTLARTRIFSGTGVQAFVQKLRNCYGHERILIAEPRGSVLYRGTKTVTSSVEFDRNKLLDLKDAWNAEARAFIESQDSLDVMQIVSEYFNMAERLYHRYVADCGLVYHSGFCEINRCLEAVEAARTVLSLSLLLQNARANGVNPYHHLCEYFSVDELRRIYCFPARSREQVDYIFLLRDPLGLADSSLRTKLYELFECAN